MSGRLAPTPSGHLHLGNVLAFGAAFLSARAANKRLLYRLEDLDRGRAREAIADAQRQELRWLGLTWDEEVAPQSQRSYDLSGLPTFRCGCNRERRRTGACTCRERPGPTNPGLGRETFRLRGAHRSVSFIDRACGPQAFTPTDDVVLQRAGGEVAYPAAVVIDDLRDGVTEVVRGADLLEPTAVQIEIHQALGAEPPTYLHTPLLVDLAGKKLAKRHQSLEVRTLREAGVTPEAIWSRLLPLLGLPGLDRLQAAIPLFEPQRVRCGPFVVDAGGKIRDLS